MSEFWLGVCTAMSVWQFINTVSAAIYQGNSITYTQKHVVGFGVFTLLWMLLSVLVYTGVLL